MKMFPIIPIWLITIICISLIIYIILSKRNYIHIAIIIILFIINLRIMIPSNNDERVSNNLNVLFVIDNTISMNALDYNGSSKRLDGVKDDCKYIIDNLIGARFSVITFDNNSKIMIPFTYDSNITYESIEIISPINELYAKGTSLNTPFDNMLKVLQNNDNSNRINVVFFISDGEITDNSKLKSFKKLSKYIDNGAVLGYGTIDGGYMKTNYQYSENNDYIKDYSSSSFQNAVSKIDENNLKKISSDLNIDYIHMDKHRNIYNKINRIKKLADSGLTKNNKSSYDDIYYIFIIPLLILLYYDFYRFRRNIL